MARLAILIVIFLVLGLCALLAITIVAALRTPAATATNTDPEVLAVLTSAQRRAWFSIGVAVALVLIIISINAAMPASLGLPIALAPMVAATGAILVQAFPGQRSFQASNSTARSASLEARTPWQYVSKPALWVPILCTLALTGFLIFTGLTASADDFGLARALHIQTENMGTGGSPYPGWYYGIPLLLAAAALLGATLLAHARLSKIAAFPRTDLSDIDRTWRHGMARIISAMSVSGTLVTLSGVSLFGGRVISSALRTLTANGEPAPAWLQSGGFIVAAGLLCLLGGLASIFMAARWAAVLKEQALTITPLDPAHRPPTNPYM